jgi:hypothetical protein
MRMDKLDLLVTQHMADRLLEPERLATLLNSLAGRRTEKAAAVDRRLAALAREAEEADERLRRLYRLVEDGRDHVDDILRARMADLKLAREKAHAALERARSGARAVEDVSPIVIERFARTMRENLTTGEVPFRKAYLGSLLDRIEVDDGEVRIVGRKEVLEQAVLAARQGEAGVHSFVPKWRAHRTLRGVRWQERKLDCASPRHSTRADMRRSSYEAARRQKVFQSVFRLWADMRGVAAARSTCVSAGDGMAQ